MSVSEESRWTEEALLEAWKASNAGKPRTRTVKAKADSLANEVMNEKNRVARCKAYVKECTPQQAGDEHILRLYGKGVRVRDIIDMGGPAAGMKIVEVRSRIIACHPKRKPLGRR